MTRRLGSAIMTGLTALAIVAPRESVAQNPNVAGGTIDRAVNLTGQTVTFQITNLVNAQVYSVSLSCVSPVVSCSSPSGNTFKAAGTTRNWNINFGTAATTGTGSITISVSGMPGQGTGTYNVNVRQAYEVSVTPDGGTQPQRDANTGGYSAIFWVSNTGINNDTYTFTCAGSNGVICGTVPAPVAVSGLGNIVQVSMPYSVGAGGGTGTLTLTATGTGVSDPGSYSVPIVSYGVSVTPDGSTAATRTANTGGYSESFTVTNTGSASNTYSFSCSGVGGVTCGTAPAAVTLGAGAQTTVSQGYSVGAPGTGTLTLTASGTNASDPGSYSVPIVSYGVSITPDGGTAPTREAYASYTESFTVTNTGSASNTYSFNCVGGSGVTCGTVPNPVALGGGLNTTVTMPYSVQGAGTGTLTLTATGTNASDPGSYNIPVVCTACFVPSTVAGGIFTKDSRYLLQETADSYDPYGRNTHLTDARAEVTTYLYGGNVNTAFLIEVTRVHDASGSVDLVTDIAYDTLGFVSSIKDEGGSFRYFTYDLFGRLRQIKNNAGTPVRAYGYMYSRTGPNWTFDPANPNAVVDSMFMQQTPSLQVVVSSWYLDGLGHAIQSVVQDGANYHVSATQYDLMGRTWRVWKPYTRAVPGYDASFTSNATTFYNTYHSPSTTVPYVETAYTPDAMSRVKQVTPEHLVGAPNAVVTNTYGVIAASSQQFTLVTDEAGKQTRSITDVFGNVVRSVLGAGAPESTVTQFTYNVLGQRLQTTDPRSLNTTYVFNTRRLQTSRTSPDAGAQSASYDKAGNLRFTQDANQTAAGNVYFTNYDFAGRALRSGLGTATFSSLNPDIAEAFENDANCLIARQYDAQPSTAVFPWSRFSAQISPLTLSNVAGRLAAVASKSSGAWQVTLFGYDADGRVIRRYTYTEANDGASILTAINTIIADSLDLRGGITQRAESVGTTYFYQWFDYDGRGLLSKTYAATTNTKPVTADVTDTYRPSGLPQDYQFQGNSLVPIRYTIREQTERIGDPSGNTYQFSARYAYQSNGVVDTAEFYNGGSPAAQKRYRYAFGAGAYDALNRLNSADFSSWSGSAWTVTPNYDLSAITYDASGNIRTMQRKNDVGSLIDNLTYNYLSGTNRLGSLSEAAGVTAETWDAEAGSFSYDPNGNVTAAPAPYSITAVAYDPANLPLSMTAGGVSSTYRYDDAGQRIAKQVNGGNTEVYLRQGATVLGVFTMSGSTLASWYFNILWDDRVVGRHTSAPVRTYYHFDPLGSVRAVVTTTGAVTESSDFDPWGLAMPGRALVSSSPVKERFSAKEQDAETGLDYFGARYYMPAVGRWGAVDPQTDSTAPWSPYCYVLDNPVLHVDPDGRQVPVGADLAVGLGTPLSGLGESGRVYAQAITATTRSRPRGNYFANPFLIIRDMYDAPPSRLGTELSMMSVANPMAGFGAMGERLVAGAALRVETARVTAYEVGTFDQLAARSLVGDALDLHHVGQAHAMQQLVPGYVRGTAPAIALPQAEHALIPNMRGPVNVSVRDLVAKAIRALRNFTNAPNSSLQELIKLNKAMYPGVFKK